MLTGMRKSLVKSRVKSHRSKSHRRLSVSVAIRYRPRVGACAAWHAQRGIRMRSGACACAAWRGAQLALVCGGGLAQEGHDVEAPFGLGCEIQGGGGGVSFPTIFKNANSTRI